MVELKGEYANAKIFANTIEEGVYSQVYDIINSKAFEGQKVVCMPDVHVGASGPCGLVATIGDYVCPEHIGVDIGCSVSMLVLNKKISPVKYAEFEAYIKRTIPFGMNINENTIIDEKEFYKFLTKGFNTYRNYWPEMLSDLPNIVDEKWITKKCQQFEIPEKVFYKSLGSVGGGNHFIEYDENSVFGAVTLHFGSRNFGKRVCQYYTNLAKNPISKKEIKDITKAFKKEYQKSHKDMSGFGDILTSYIEQYKSEHFGINGYLTGDNMKNYLCDMCFAQLYAQYNHKTVQTIITKFLKTRFDIDVVKTIMTTHNFIDLHDHTLRKSAIRSYKGEEFILPFNMADGVVVCEGLSNADWLNSCAHGAGRKMSRTQAKKTLTMNDFTKSMKNVYSTTVCEGTIDESPMAYKNTNEIEMLIKDTCTIKYRLYPKINIKAVE